MSARGIVLLKAKRSERYAAINLSGNQVSAILPRSARPGPPGTGMGIQTHTPDVHVSDLRPADDYRFFADVLASAAVTVTGVDLDVAAGSHEPQATVRIRRGTKESAVSAPVSQALALAAATDAPIRAPAAVLAVGGLATGGHPPPEPADVVRAVEAAEASHRLSQALTTAVEARSGTVTLRLIPAGGPGKDCGCGARGSRYNPGTHPRPPSPPGGCRGKPAPNRPHRSERRWRVRSCCASERYRDTPRADPSPRQLTARDHSAHLRQSSPSPHGGERAGGVRSRACRFT